MASVGINYEDRARNFGHMPELQLFQMASNDSTRLEYRLYAVELLLEKGYKSADKPELAALRAEVLKTRELAGDPIVPYPAADRENAAAARLLRLDESLADGQVLNNAAQAEYGVLKSSITTASLSQEPEVLQNADAAAENADSGGTSSNAGDNSDSRGDAKDGRTPETGAALSGVLQTSGSYSGYTFDDNNAVQKTDEPSVAQDSVTPYSVTQAPEVEPTNEAASQEAATPSTSE